MSESLYFGPTPAGREDRHPFSLAVQRPFTRLRVAAAFATESGVVQIEHLVDSAAFASAQKQWLIGLENGFTQPAALRRLIALPNSELCLVDIHAVLKSPGLAGSTFFHPKVYEFASPQANETTIITTSANLTEGGLRNNIEQFLSWDGSSSGDVAKTLTTWWSKYWKPEWLATEALIGEYAARRPVIQRMSGAGLPGTGDPIVEIEPPASELRAATQMWIEAVRPLEGGSNNQLELMLNAHSFFFPDLEDVPRDVPGRSYLLTTAARNSRTPTDRSCITDRRSGPRATQCGESTCRPVTRGYPVTNRGAY